MTATERWILISNCQTHGLAHSMQMLAKSIRVEPVDMAQYKTHIDHYNSSFGNYDRVLIGLGAEAIPSADFSRARRIDKVPELVFTAYHPDLAYVMDGTTVVNGPAGAYHSMIALAAHSLGHSVDDTVSLFAGDVYAASGYYNGWAASRDDLVHYCAGLGYDVSEAVQRWGRRGAFMYSSNHPRIHVLYDIARLYLEREGYPVRVSDVLPHDNLVASSVFPVYPEVGDALGVPGSYLFKRVNEYTQIDLHQFVDESFDLYNSHELGQLVVNQSARASFEKVVTVIKDRVTA